MNMGEADTVAAKTGDCERFIEKATVAAAVVSRIKTFDEAVDYVVNLCLNKELTRYEVDDAGIVLEGGRKTIAAPAISESEFTKLAEKTESHEIDCIQTGMRDRLAGVDIGFTYADLGLAETGTIVLNCPDEELRLATMVCEHHVCIVPKSRIAADGYAAEQQLTEFMLDAPTYTAFITGPSRTADIERVLSIGVHGPLELHLLILEEDHA